MDLILLQFGLQDFAIEPNVDGTAGKGDSPAWSTLTGDPDGAKKIDGSKCIELVSINQEIKQQVTTNVSNYAPTSGRPVISEFTCVKHVDSKSHKMYDFCLRSKTLDVEGGAPTILWGLSRSGEQLKIILRIELRLALISEINFQAHPNGIPTEQFKLNFTEIDWHHQVQGEDLDTRKFLSQL